MSSILVIEDHAAFGKALLRLLKEKSGLEVVGIVQTGEEALEKLPGLDVDLLLIDVSLPRMNGIQLAGMIHEKHPETSYLPHGIGNGTLSIMRPSAVICWKANPPV